MKLVLLPYNKNKDPFMLRVASQRLCMTVHDNTTEPYTCGSTLVFLSYLLHVVAGTRQPGCCAYSQQRPVRSKLLP